MKPDLYSPIEFDYKVYQAMNKFRRVHGKPELRMRPLHLLNNVAKDHCNYMLAARQMSHENFEMRGEMFIEIYNENVAYGRFANGNEVVRRWVYSIHGHAENMLKDWTHVGIASVIDHDMRRYVTACFIRAIRTI